MHVYLISWAVTFASLGLAIIATAWVYRLMGDGLELHGWRQELITALVVSAGQAGGYVLEQHFPLPSSYSSAISGRHSIAVMVFVLCLWLGYKLTHLTSGDDLEYFIWI